MCGITGIFDTSGSNVSKKILRKMSDTIIHRGPDGDAMGSSLALYNLLQKDHNVTVITPNDYASFLNWMPGNANVIEFIGNEDKCKAITDNADLIFNSLCSDMIILSIL